MLSVGVDIVEIRRVEKAIERWGERFLSRVYTPAEIEYCHGRTAELAARFAGKEAVVKALGTGIGQAGWLEVEILPDRWGKPQVSLRGGAQWRAQQMGLKEVAISLSHSQEYAIAFVVAN
ncbi:MAG: holo-ACP synthase [Anaerolineae bacterium]